MGFGSVGSGECFKRRARRESVGIESGRCNLVKILGGGCTMTLCMSMRVCRDTKRRSGVDLERLIK